MQYDTDGPSNPWYQEFWAWFIITPLVIIVIVMTIFITIAYSSRDDIVTDNYQKKGRMLNTSFEAENYARELGLTGQFYIDKQTDILTLLIIARLKVFAPELTLVLSHPFESEKDAIFKMKKIPQDMIYDESILASIEHANMHSEQVSGKPTILVFRSATPVAIEGKRYLRASYFAPLSQKQKQKTDSLKFNPAQDALEIWRISGEMNFDRNFYTELTP